MVTRGRGKAGSTHERVKAATAETVDGDVGERREGACEARLQQQSLRPSPLSSRGQNGGCDTSAEAPAGSGLWKRLTRTGQDEAKSERVRAEAK